MSWVLNIRSFNGIPILGDVAKRAHKFARYCGGADPTPHISVEDNDFLIFLDTTIENLQALASYSKDYIDAITVKLGQEHSGQSLPDIFEQFALTPDVEGAQQWIREACHYLIIELVHRDEGVVTYLKDLIKSLEESRANLNESSKALDVERR